MPDPGLKIGDLARRTGVDPRTIRFYEAVGVLPPPGRGRNGYRLYAGDAVDVLRFIKQAQGLGLTLAEIREIVAIRQGGRPPCSHVYQLLREKAAELDRKLREDPGFLEPLRGNNLGCTCPPALPCHADILLRKLYGR